MSSIFIGVLITSVIFNVLLIYLSVSGIGEKSLAIMKHLTPDLKSLLCI